MKKLLVFGVIALFIGLAFIPSFNAVSISKTDDTTPPYLSLSYDIIPAHDEWSIKIIANATDYESGMDRVEFYLNNKLQDIVTGSGPVYTWEWFYIDVLESYVEVRAYDKAGNVAIKGIDFRSPLCILLNKLKHKYEELMNYYEDLWKENIYTHPILATVFHNIAVIYGFLYNKIVILRIQLGC